MQVLLTLFALACGASIASAAERIICATTVDTWIEMPTFDVSNPGAAELARNHAADHDLVIRGRESFALLQFELSNIKGLAIEKATLRIHRRPDPVPLHTIGLSTVSGNGLFAENANFFTPGKGAGWAYPGSDLLDVTFAQGGSLYAYKPARDAGDGWYEVDVPAAVVAAMAIGDQFGLMVDDEKGQTQTRHVLDSRESAFPPVLIVEGSRVKPSSPGIVRLISSAGTPAAAKAIGRTSLRPGSLILRLAGPAARYDLRYSELPIDRGNFDGSTPVPRWSINPLAPKAHPLATFNTLGGDATAVVEQLQPGKSYYFAARAVDAVGNAGPVSALGWQRAYARTYPTLPPTSNSSPARKRRQTETGSVKVWVVPELLKIDPRTGALLERDYPNHRERNSVWDSATGVITLTGARNEFLGFQLAIESAQPISGIEVKMIKPLFAASKLPKVLRETGAVQFYREWFVPDDRNTGAARPWYPDALVPLTASFDLPARDNVVPGQTVQPVFADVYIPHGAAVGTHEGVVQVRMGAVTRDFSVRVRVLPLRLPDRLNFTVDLNCYSSVASGYDVKLGTPEYRMLEQAYHRMAHLHRTNLDVLGYHHDGSTVADHAPPLEGEGSNTRVQSWRDWDLHWGALLDGSAFADLPRAGVPVPAMYLPFFEDWPGDLRKSYRFNDYPIAKTEDEFKNIVTRHALAASPIEEAFSKEYQDRYSAVVGEFAEHIRQRGWRNTRYFVYFNNKYYYKRPSQGGRGVSWWLMDEPNHRDDVRATSFLAYLTKRNLDKYPDVPIFLRTDISRVEWIRDLLAGQIDLNCISKRFFDKNRYLQDDRHRFGKEYWNYASTNHPRDSNVSMRAWCWRVWLNGGDGLLPWNAVRGSAAWDRAEPLTVFYPGTKFGKSEPFGSLRLKAYRRGQQDIEYLVLLAQQRGWDRDAVTMAMDKALDLSGRVKAESEEDAGTISFRNIKDTQLEDLRLRAAQAMR
jgi:hypothetical protein